MNVKTVSFATRTSTWVSLRAFTQSTRQFNKASTASPTDTTTTASKSSVAAGTVLKGINYTKDGSDPVAMEDTAYPEWLWTLLTPRPPTNTMDKGSKQRLRRVNRETIRDTNFMKSQ
ncbi:mitochondrial ribosomal protein L37-domain-containing protein [Syncephalis fuscata]|nr:mitochondrial ribosomal protein L37-domain-containing protein [Syncephalis fuscata]